MFDPAIWFFITVWAIFQCVRCRNEYQRELDMLLGDDFLAGGVYPLLALSPRRIWRHSEVRSDHRHHWRLDHFVASWTFVIGWKFFGTSVFLTVIRPLI